MAISTEINSLLADQMFAIYSNAEYLMLEKVRKRVQRGIKENGWAERKLADVSKLREELGAIVNDADRLAKGNVGKAIVDAYKNGKDSVQADLGLPRNILKELEIPEHIQRLMLEANNMITQTSVQILRSTDDAYRKMQAETAMGVLSGVDTPATAAKRLLNRLADAGITSFIDKAGRNWEMGAYAEMATRTVTARAALQGHIDRQVELGMDLCIVSAHSGSCPVCRPWGGKVLSLSGNSDYPSYASALAAGLFHPNCRHTVSVYIPGITDEALEEIGVPAQRSPELYDYTQKQRYNERQIRRWKRREAVAITPQDSMIARNKIREWQLEQRNLLKECEFRFGTAPRRKYDRESIRNRQGKAGIEDMQLWTGIKPRTELPKREYKKRQKTINFSDYKYLYDGGYSMGKNSPVENIRRDSDYLRSLNDSDRFAVERYTGGSYSAMNDYFRKGISGGVSTDKKALAVKKVLDDAPELMENTILFRHDGLGTVRHLFNDDARNLADKAVNAASAEALIELKKLITNATFTEKGFLSTSYAKGVFTQDRGLEVQLYMPKGFNRGLFVEEVSNFSNEREFVIGQGQKFKVVDVEVGDIISNMHDSEPSIRNLIIKAVPIK